MILRVRKYKGLKKYNKDLKFINFVIYMFCIFFIVNSSFSLYVYVFDFNCRIIGRNSR